MVTNDTAGGIDPGGQDGQVGLIGVGTIGTHFVSRLVGGGYRPLVFDIDEGRRDAAVDLGARSADDARDVARASDTVLLSLPDDEALASVMEGASGILGSLSPGTVVVNTGTSRPSTDVRYEALCHAKDVGFVEAPVTWREHGLIVMAAGTQDHFERVREVLECVSYKLGFVGAIGRGQLMKLLNQILAANHLAADAEALEVCRAIGLDPSEVGELLESDRTWGRGFRWLATLDTPHARAELSLHYKDLLYVLELAHERGINIPITSQVHEIFKATKVYGDDDWMQAGIVSYWKRLNEGR